MCSPWSSRRQSPNSQQRSSPISNMIRPDFIPAENWQRIEKEAHRLNDVMFLIHPVLTGSRKAENSVYIKCTEVYPNVILGGRTTAQNKKYLEQIGVTHVVNAAMGTEYDRVDTNAAYYAKNGIKFYGVNLDDSASCHIAMYFESVTNFIDDALNSGGKVRYAYFSVEDWPRILEEANKLFDVLLSVRPEPRSAKNSKNVDCNEVYPDVFIGDGETAKNKNYLKQIGVTHVVNAAMGTGCDNINTNAEFYAKKGMTFFGVSLGSKPYSRISPHFESVANYVEDALNSGGKVFVHCVHGRSRSATFVIAFLMIKRFMTAESAMRLLRSKRFIGPKFEFLAELAAFEFKLREEHADYPRRDSCPNGIDSATQIEKTRTKKCNVQ